MNAVLKSASAVLGLVTVLSATAAPITPTFTTFGQLAGVTFGGSGIPNSPAAVTTWTNATGQVLTMGLIATPRFTGVVTNNGAGTYSSVAGVSPFGATINQAASPTDPYAVWNFSSYIGGAAASGLEFKLFYDFDPTIGNDINTHGSVAFSGATAVGARPNGSSSNLGFDSLATSGSAFGFTTVAPSGSFNPNAGGQYSFALVAYNRGDAGSLTEVARSAILVSVVPEPGTFALAGLALLGLFAARRRT